MLAFTRSSKVKGCHSVRAGLLLKDGAQLAALVAGHGEEEKGEAVESGLWGFVRVRLAGGRRMDAADGACCFEGGGVRDWARAGRLDACLAC